MTLEAEAKRGERIRRVRANEVAARREVESLAQALATAKREYHRCLLIRRREEVWAEVEVKRAELLRLEDEAAKLKMPSDRTFTQTGQGGKSSETHGPDSCDNCGRNSPELFHNEASGLAYCDDCETAASES